MFIARQWIRGLRQLWRLFGRLFPLSLREQVVLGVLKKFASALRSTRLQEPFPHFAVCLARQLIHVHASIYGYVVSLLRWYSTRLAMRAFRAYNSHRAPSLHACVSLRTGSRAQPFLSLQRRWLLRCLGSVWLACPRCWWQFYGIVCGWCHEEFLVTIVDAVELIEWSMSLVCRSCRFLRLKLWRLWPRSHSCGSLRKRCDPRGPDGPAHPDLREFGHCT